MNNIYAQNTDFLFMIEQAVKAPSAHNTQPWLFKINEASIEIHPNLKKSLPIVDFNNREMFISLGCATENLCIAASFKGYESAVSISELGSITVNLTKHDSVKNNPLFEQIAARQSNRSIFKSDMINEETIAKLKSICIEPTINVYSYKKRTVEFDYITDFIIRANTIQMQDKAFKKELWGWMRFNKKHQDKTNDGLSYAVFGAPNLPKFIVKPIMAMTINEKSQNKVDRKKIESSSHLILFTTRNNGIKEWINLGRSLERFLLKSTEMGIVHSHLNQPNEIRELAEKMADRLCLPEEYANILIRLGYGKIMPYSKRKNIREVITYE